MRVPHWTVAEGDTLETIARAVLIHDNDGKIPSVDAVRVYANRVRDVNRYAIIEGRILPGMTLNLPKE